jgi:hypothetical protein
MASAETKRQEERVKLLASALSNLGVASIVAGLVGPALGGRLKGAIGGEAAIAGLLLHGVAQLLLHYVVVTPRAATADNQEAEP